MSNNNNNCPTNLPTRHPYRESDPDVAAKFYRRMTQTDPGLARQYVKNDFPLWPVCGQPCFKKCADQNANSNLDAGTIGNACVAACSATCNRELKCDEGAMKVNDKKIFSFTVESDPFGGDTVRTSMDPEIAKTFNPNLSLGRDSQGKEVKGSFDQMHTKSEEAWVPEYDADVFKAVSASSVKPGQLGRYSVSSG